jgi:hypothetical protein
VELSGVLDMKLEVSGGLRIEIFVYFGLNTFRPLKIFCCFNFGPRNKSSNLPI